MNEIVVIIISLALGSFGNNLISYYSRFSVGIPRTKFDLFRSHCMCGDKLLNLNELIPLVSFIYLKGKCILCSKKISHRYPAVELITAAIGLLCYSLYEFPYSILYFSLFFTLLIIGIIDFLSYTIPNIFILALLLLAGIKYFIASTAFTLSHFGLPLCGRGAALPVYLPLGMAHWRGGEGVIYSLLTSALIPLFFILLNLFFIKRMNKEAIGLGDIKLIIALTLVFNFFTVLLGIWLSAVSAIICFYLLKSFTSRFKYENRVPFGFFLSSSFIVITICENQLLSFYYWLVGI